MNGIEANRAWPQFQAEATKTVRTAPNTPGLQLVKGGAVEAMSPPVLPSAQNTELPNGATGLQGIETLLSTLITQVIQPVILALTQVLQSLAGSLGIVGQATPSNQLPVPGTEGATPQQPQGQAPSADTQASSPQSAGSPSPTSSTTSEPEATSASPHFQYKPFSEKDKNIAILLPSSLTGESARVEILAPNSEKVLSRGRFSGTDKGSGREVFRFDKQGSDLPDGSIVRITMQDGKTKTIKLNETSEGLKRTIR